MEFPELGKHCSLSSCKQLDFLPFTCDACKKIFCKDHLSYETHSCEESYLKDRRALVCPLCNQPIASKPGEIPDARVNDHIENDCRSDLAKAKRKTYTNRCSQKGCKQRELVPVLCGSCRQNYCLRHRHENDHNCPAKPSSTTPQGARSNSAAAVMAGEAASSRFTRRKTSSGTPQQTSLSNMGSDLNRERQERQQQRPRPSSRTIPTPTQASGQRPGNIHQPAMSEDEALAFAIQESLSDRTQSTNEPPVSSPTATSQEDEDLALARAIAESEREERNRQSQQQPQQQRQNGLANKPD